MTRRGPDEQTTGRQSGRGQPSTARGQNSSGAKKGLLHLPRAGGHIPPAEWAVAAVGLVLFLGTLAFLVVEAARPGQPPDVAVTVDRITAAADGYVVTVTAANSGDETATEVTVEGVLTGRSGDTADEPVEKAEITFDYLAAHSAMTGALVFQRDPAAFGLAVRPKSYRLR